MPSTVLKYTDLHTQLNSFIHIYNICDSYLSPYQTYEARYYYPHFEIRKLRLREMK